MLGIFREEKGMLTAVGHRGEGVQQKRREGAEERLSTGGGFRAKKKKKGEKKTNKKREEKVACSKGLRKRDVIQRDIGSATDRRGRNDEKRKNSQR